MFCSHLERSVQSFQHKWKSIPITSKVELELSVLYEHCTCYFVGLMKEAVVTMVTG